MPFGGGNLGFPYQLWLAVLFVVTVAGFVARRRWRIWMARSEEIERLLLLAAEETARIEVEASVGYSIPVETISRPFQHQCAVCFCPTTTRCSRCKAVRYCSGKCQIIHWRQGHKDDCIPFTTDQNSDEGVLTFKNVLRKEENYVDNSLEFDKSHEEPALSKLDYSSEDSCGNGHGSDLECLADGKGSSCSSDENEKSELPACNLSDDLNKLKPDYPHHDVQCGLSSSGWSEDGSNHSPFSDLSTSSGFWEGASNSNRSKIDVLDDSSSVNSSVDGDADIHSSHNSQSFSTGYDRNVSLPKTSSSTKTFIARDVNLSAMNIKKPMDQPVLSERSDNVPKSRNSSLSSPTKFEHTTVSASEDSPVSKLGQSRYFTSSGHASSTTARPGGTPAAKLASEVSTTHPPHRDGSNNTVNDKSTSPALKTKESGMSSSASGVLLSSSISRHSIKCVDSGKVDRRAVVGTSDNAKASPNVGNGLKTSMTKVVDQLRVSKSSRHYQSGVLSVTAGRYSDKGLFPYEQFVKLYHWNKAEFRPSGLINCGNSCYANSVLQCLACTPPLTAYFIEGLHSKTCETNAWCFTCELESLVQKANEGASPLSPFRIVSKIQKIGSQLINGREEDAHEFLRYAIDLMQSSCLKKPGINAPSSSEEETTLIGLTFGGYLRSKIKCMKCGGKSERHEKIMDLNVEIQGDIETLEEALRQFTGNETLDGDNKYQCSRCRSYEKAIKKLTILEAPNILTIALKRFQSGNYGKLNKSIRFPEILNLAPYMSRTNDKSPVYRLYGVVVHLDTNNAAFSGHYVCYVKNSQNKWFKIDDSVVQSVELDSVLSKKAYMLLYARCLPRAPRLIRNSIVPPDPKKPKNPSSKSRPHHTCPWDASGSDPLNGRSGTESLYPNQTSYQKIRTVVEEDSSSDNSSFFSEGHSCSTESSNRDSSADDLADHIFGDQGGQVWNGSLWKNWSDSDSSSSSSSSSSPFPIYSDSGKCRNLEVSCRSANSNGLELDDSCGESIRRRSWRSKPV